MTVQLPAALAEYFAAANADDADRVAACFAEDAVVRDEAREMRGRAAIRAWAAEVRRQYHFHHATERGELLRRLDHAAIFVMIAGTYTPFTVGILNGAAAVWSTGSMWAAALAGAAVKLAYPRRFEWITIVFYLGLGWAAVVFMRPLLAALDRPTLILIVMGGIVYSIGAGIHSWRRLPFHDAIWHALVLIAAGCHYAAI